METILYVVAFVLTSNIIPICNNLTGWKKYVAAGLLFLLTGFMFAVWKDMK